MISIQTNVASLVAQENLNTNTNFQGNTIRQLTSGYRINASGDDAAGLAVANKYRSDIAELNQGVLNANDGLSTLQIADGGMNNISLMLDRLNTLATQSASAAFTGNRVTVNSEFQSLVTEINRQSQAIGLNTNGVLNTNIQVFMGGGKAQGTNADSTVNGTVNIDLTSAAVDTRTLGLSGMVAVGGTADIGNGSSTHTVSQILANGANTTSGASTTDLFFSGAGYSDANSVKVAVNLSGVTDINSLVTALNSAIAGAGGGASQSDAAFKGAGIVASVHTDGSGGQQLQFSSSNSAFQVSAGDVMANALLGSFVSTSQGNALTSTVAGATTTAGTIASPTGVTVQITGGGLAAPVSLSLGSGSTTTALALTDLANQVTNNAALQAAGITMTGTAGSTALTFTSGQGQTMNVAVTGDTANMLGYGSFQGGLSNVPDYQTITGGAAYTNTVAAGTANLQISLNGGAASANAISVNLAQGTATAGTAVGTVAGAIADQTGLTLTMKIDGSSTVRTVTFGTDISIAASATQINTASLAGSWGVTASVDINGHLNLTSATKGATSDVNVTGGTAQAALGVAIQHNYGASRTETDLLAQINAQIAASTAMSGAGLSAVDSSGSIQIASNNGTFFRLSASTSTAVTGDIGFGVGSSSTYGGVTLSSPASTQYSIASQGAANAAGTTGASLLTWSNLVDGNNAQAITLSANDSSGNMQTKTITLANDAAATRNGQTIDQAISYINQQLQQTNNATLQQIVAVKEDSSGTQKINFISGLNNFTLTVGAGAAGVNSGTASSVASTTLGTGNTVAVDTMANAIAAVSAIGAATTKLGSAQAGVGRGENQLNWAINLAQSQISNFSAAQSRIRDADVAAEAANLTKAQVLQQASIAAMAQANSAPQAVLALLRT